MKEKVPLDVHEQKDEPKDEHEHVQRDEQKDASAFQNVKKKDAEEGIQVQEEEKELE